MPDDLDTVGLMPETRFSRKPSAVSQALRAIRDDIYTGKELRSTGASPHPANYRILVAADRLTRERAYVLAHRVYQRAGYVAEGSPALCVSRHDTSEQTLTLLAEDSDGNSCATISLVCDSSEGLPCDEIYSAEVNEMRAASCRLAEVTRLAIDESCNGAKELLLHLFNHCYIFSRVVRGQTDLLVEVNPRHVNYYRRLLRFKQAGPERPCSRVQGAPALLLRLNFSEIEATVKGTGCTHGRDTTGGRLHPYPYSQPEEEAIAHFLAQEHRPMSADDACYFHLLQRQPCTTSSVASGQ